MPNHGVVNDIEDGYNKVGVLAREIIVKRTIITSTLATVLTVLVALHVIPIDLSYKITGLVAVGFGYLVTIVGALWARSATTPADPALNPQSVGGAPLVVDTSDTIVESDFVKTPSTVDVTPVLSQPDPNATKAAPVVVTPPAP